MAYERVNWENLPSTKTPVNADNLNKMDEVINSKQDKLTAGTGIEITGENIINNLNENYSTDEQIVGKWINGKPIYRKVVVYTGAKSNYLIVPHGISNFETVINITGKMGSRILNTAYSNNGTLNTDNFFAFIYLVDTTNIEISLSNYFVEQRDSLIFILEYTKTTD